MDNWYSDQCAAGRNHCHIVSKMVQKSKVSLTRLRYESWVLHYDMCMPHLVIRDLKYLYILDFHYVLVVFMKVCSNAPHVYSIVLPPVQLSMCRHDMRCYIQLLKVSIINFPQLPLYELIHFWEIELECPF